MPNGILQNNYSYISQKATALTLNLYSNAIANSSITGLSDNSPDLWLSDDNKNGLLDRSIGYNLWNKILITPTSIVRTIVTTDENVNGTIWNTYKILSQTINSYTFDLNIDGINVLNISLPATLLPLADDEFIYQLTPIGVFEVDGYITWDTTSNSATTYFDFIRGLFLPFLPQNYKELELFSTNLFISMDNTEKRNNLSSKPNFQFNYTIPLSPKEIAEYLSNFMRLGIERSLLQPVWSHTSIVSSVVGTTVNCDTDYRDFTQYILFYRNIDYNEIGFVSSVSSGVITLQQTLTKSFVSGDLVIPMRLVSTNKNLSVNFDNYNIAKFNMELFEISPLVLYEGTPDLTTTYKSYDVLTFSPEFGVKNIHNNDFILLGDIYNKNIKYKYSDQIEIIEFKYLLTTRQDIFNFRKFFENKKGRYGKFWLPSWKADFTLQQDATAGSGTLRVSGTNFKYSATLIRHIFIEPNFYAKIDGYTEIDDNTIDITLDTTIPADLKANTIISNLYFVRFNSDNLNIEFVATDYNTASIICTFKELQTETP